MNSLSVCFAHSTGDQLNLAAATLAAGFIVSLPAQAGVVYAKPELKRVGGMRAA
jgi:hypothetical protein